MEAFGMFGFILGLGASMFVIVTSGQVALLRAEVKQLRAEIERLRSSEPTTAP